MLPPRHDEVDERLHELEQRVSALENKAREQGGRVAIPVHEQWLPSASDQEDYVVQHGDDDDPSDPCDRPEHLARVAALARTFPSLARVEHPRLAGLDPFDPDQLDNWAGCTGPAYFAALFILQVTSAGEHWESGTFNAVVAMLAWDEANRRAFLAWAAEPWGGSR